MARLLLEIAVLAPAPLSYVIAIFCFSGTRFARVSADRARRLGMVGGGCLVLGAVWLTCVAGYNYYFPDPASPDLERDPADRINYLGTLFGIFVVSGIPAAIYWIRFFLIRRQR